jgi:[phosphatase 2A protein]-leucine-carboxy methyltransferase
VISRVPRLRNLIHADASSISIGRDPLNASLLMRLDVDAGSILSPTYCLHPMDIRQLPLLSSLPPYLDPTLPTVFISECCLVYLDQEEATNVLRWITESFKNSVGVIIYEPIGGYDAFGKVMIRNLAVNFISGILLISSVQRD